MMSVSSFSNFTILIKKIARKSSLRKRFSTTKKQQRTTHLHKTTNTIQEDQDIGSISTCSSNEDDNSKPVVIMKNVPVTIIKTEKQQLNDESLKKKKSMASIHSAKTTITEIKNKQDENNETIINNKIDNDQESTINDEENDVTPIIKVRDYGYSTTSSLHHGFIEPAIQYNNNSSISLSSERFNGRKAKVLYDFIPETDYEIAMNVGQMIWIQYRQCDGWLMAEIDNETGLVPESYIEFI